MDRRDPTLLLAERVLVLLDAGRRITTYKFAVLHALIDVVQRRFGEPRGPGAGTVTTLQLAERVIELYWTQTQVHGEAGHRLRQARRGRRGRSTDGIPRDVAELARELGHPRTPRLARGQDRSAYDALLAKVEKTLVLNPIPRLQRVGGESEPFLYITAWTPRSIDPPSLPEGFAAYQRAWRTGARGAGRFDNRLLLLEGVEEGLVRLAGILLPLIRREWSRAVAAWNRDVLDLTEEDIESFLFDPERQSLRAVAPHLRDLQEGRCFYCRAKLPRRGDHVDHFLPWRRTREDAIENFVLTDGSCNAAKSDHLSAQRHVEAWSARLLEHGDALADLGRDLGFESAPRRVQGLARSTYLALPPRAPLWIEADRFEPLEDPEAFVTEALSPPLEI